MSVRPLIVTFTTSIGEGNQKDEDRAPSSFEVEGKTRREATAEAHSEAGTSMMPMVLRRVVVK